MWCNTYSCDLRLSVWAVLAIGALGCSSTIDDSMPRLRSGAPAATGSGGAGFDSGSGGSGGLIDGQMRSDGPLACTPAAPPAVTRVARLTHLQYDNAVRELTGLDVHPSLEFLADPHQAGFDRGVDLRVGDVLELAYRDAAESLAQQVVDTPAAYNKVLGCQPASGDACAQSYVAAFGKRAFRRPLTDGEQASFMALFAQGATLYDGGDAFRNGVQITLEGFLQSPKFLYRVELSDARSEGMIALNPYEIASRLSFMLVNTTPDPTLMAAADAGQLSSTEAVAAQAARLLGTDAAKQTVRDFHQQWLDMDIYANKLTKDATRYPTVTPDLAPVLQEETLRFAEAVTFDRKRGYASLMTAPFTFANATTAEIYDVPGSFTAALKEVELDPAQRGGLLTQIGFLATHAFTTISSPIHRGVFVQRRIMCATIPDPPPNIPSLPAIDGTTIKTTRQQVDTHTQNEPCRSCHHTMINPVGFGFENFDAIGRFRAQENGEDVDASGTLVGTEDNAPFTNAVELSQAIADSPEGRLCYAKNWLRYTLGRAETDGDSCALSTIAERLSDDTYTALDLLEDMTRSKAFLFRTPEAP